MPCNEEYLNGAFDLAFGTALKTFDAKAEGGEKQDIYLVRNKLEKKLNGLKETKVRENEASTLESLRNFMEEKF